jgi:hypothetical protein
MMQKAGVVVGVDGAEAGPVALAHQAPCPAAVVRGPR